MYFQTILLFRLLERKLFLENISAKEESEKADEFHDSQKCLGESSGKKFSKNFFHGFCMFFKFKGSILRLFFPLDFPLFFPLFFYSFLSAVIT